MRSGKEEEEDDRWRSIAGEGRDGKMGIIGFMAPVGKEGTREILRRREGKGKKGLRTFCCEHLLNVGLAI